MKTRVKRLALPPRETLRNLQDADLRSVWGGFQGMNGGAQAINGGAQYPQVGGREATRHRAITGADCPISVGGSTCSCPPTVLPTVVNC